MTETPFFFVHDSWRLFGVHHEPEPSMRRNAGIVLCDPFAEEKGIAYRMFTFLARRLAGAGFPVLRFDYRGTGDSAGEMDDGAPSGYVTDIQGAVRELCSRTAVERIGLLGLRVGASLAAVAAETTPQVTAAVLWEPILDGGDFVDQYLRLQVMGGGVTASGEPPSRDAMRAELASGRSVDVLGMPLSPDCYRELSDLELSDRTGEFAGDLLIVSLSRRAKRKAELDQLAARYSRVRSVDVQTFEGAPFWVDPHDPYREMRSWYANEEVLTATAAWFEKVMQ